jgi:glycosyltransferase involved in cell wall biosynthesis
MRSSPALDVVVCPSVREPLGMVVIEAMAARPARGGLGQRRAREILQHGRTGLLFRTGDPRALADALTPAPRRCLPAGVARCTPRAEVAQRFHRDRYAADIQDFMIRLAVSATPWRAGSRSCASWRSPTSG